MLRDFAIDAIKSHDLANPSKPLFLMMTWSGPHLPYDPEYPGTVDKMKAEHCAEEHGRMCSSDEIQANDYYDKCQFIERAYRGSGRSPNSGGCRDAAGLGAKYAKYQVIAI